MQFEEILETKKTKKKDDLVKFETFLLEVIEKAPSHLFHEHDNIVTIMHTKSGKCIVVLNSNYITHTNKYSNIYRLEQLEQLFSNSHRHFEYLTHGSELFEEDLEAIFACRKCLRGYKKCRQKDIVSIYDYCFH